MFLNSLTATNSVFYPFILMTALFAKMEISNVSIESSMLANHVLFEFDYAREVKVSNVTMNQFQTASSTAESIFRFNTLPYSSVTLQGWSITNSSIGEHDMVDFNPTMFGSLIATDLYFSGIQIRSMILKLGTVNNLQITNSTFDSIIRQDQSDETDTILSIDTISLMAFGVYKIHGITITNSAVTFFRMDNVNSANVSGKQLQIDSLQFMNMYSKYSVDIVSLENMETISDFEIIMSGIEASNITFLGSGNLFRFQQQTATPLTLKNSNFNDLYGASIYLESSNLLNQELMTSVRMVNITATRINSGTNSFIINNEGGYLEVYNSTFTNMSNVERGAVITGGYQNSQTMFYDSKFLNNTSIYGGVANVHSGSVVKFYSCELTNNFAVQSGVIQISNDGYFEIFDSQVTNNYAYTVPISEMFISSLQSKISGSKISNNVALTREFVMSQIESCTELCYFSDSFKEYLSSNSHLLESKRVKYGLQCISSSLIIGDN